MESLLNAIAVGLFALVLGALIALLTGLVVMFLWNWLLTDLFGFKAITWIQGWGLAFLGSILFKGSSSSSSK